MHTHISHNTMPHQNYRNDGYSYPSSLYNPTSFPYSNPSMHTVSHAAATGSPQDYHGFSVPSYHTDQAQYVASHPSILPSGSSTADSNGSISEFDANRNPIKKRRKPAPTIATGRRNLKDESVNVEEADRRDKRRERNRKSAQRCRERKIEKKDALEKQITHASLACTKYIELAEGVLKAWKQRLHLLNEKMPCHNYKAQLSVTDFENLIEAMHNRNRELSDNGDSSGSLVGTGGHSGSVGDRRPGYGTLEVEQEYGQQHLQGGNTFGECAKIEPFYGTYDVVPQTSFEQYHIPESNISYI